MHYLEDAAQRIARAVGLDPHYVGWEYVTPIRGEGLVVSLPWARVVVARSVTGAEGFIADYKRGQCSWLLDSIEAMYPHERTPFLHPERLLELPISDKKLAGFMRWGVKVRGRGAWPVTREIGVIGSWSTYRDAVLVRGADGRCALRQRVTAHPGGPHGNQQQPHSQAHQPTAT